MAAAQQFSGQQLTSVLWLVLVVGVFYFLAIRPPQKRKKEHEEFVAAIEPGDTIVTIGGLHGTIKRVDEATVTVQIAKGTIIVVDRGAIARAEGGESPAEESQ